ncbi:MAG: hypothetical protein AAFR46_06580 [Pseudomonadota bacterium]
MNIDDDLRSWELARDAMFNVTRTERLIDAQSMEDLVSLILGEVPVTPYLDALRADYEIVVCALEDLGMPAPHRPIQLDNEGIGWAYFDNTPDLESFDLLVKRGRAKNGIAYLERHTEALTKPWWFAKFATNALWTLSEENADRRLYRADRLGEIRRMVSMR